MSIMESGRTLTKRERALYRTSTGLVLAVMVFSIVNFVFNDRFPFPNGPEGAFVHLGFPPYFKIELTVAKILGVLALVIPTVPFKVKEFAYAGFAITLVSAAIAHFGRGDARNLSVLFVVDPLVFFCLLAVSYYLLRKEPFVGNRCDGCCERRSSGAICRRIRLMTSTCRRSKPFVRNAC